MHPDIRKYLYSNKPENVLDQCNTAWDFSERIPTPKIPLFCGFCKGDKLLIREVSFNKKKNSPSIYRCNVSMKCAICSNVTIFGVVITKEYWENRLIDPSGEPRLSHTFLREYFKEVE